jgi:hypothetical protein
VDDYAEAVERAARAYLRCGEAETHPEFLRAARAAVDASSLGWDVAVRVDIMNRVIALKREGAW